MWIDDNAARLRKLAADAARRDIHATLPRPNYRQGARVWRWECERNTHEVELASDGRKWSVHVDGREVWSGDARAQADRVACAMIASVLGDRR